MAPSARAVVVHSSFAPTLAEVLPRLPQVTTILQVADESGNDLLPGAVWYEDALAAASNQKPDVEWSPDDLYMLYTGGTTGVSKGVMQSHSHLSCNAQQAVAWFPGLKAGEERLVKALREQPSLKVARDWLHSIREERNTPKVPAPVERIANGNRGPAF